MKAEDIQVGDVVQIDAKYSWPQTWFQVVSITTGGYLHLRSSAVGLHVPPTDVIAAARPKPIQRRAKIKPSELEAWFWRQEGAHAYRNPGFMEGPNPDRPVQILTSTAAVLSSVGWCVGVNLAKAILELRKRLRKAGQFKP